MKRRLLLLLLLLLLFAACSPPRSPSLAALAEVWSVSATDDVHAVQLLGDHAPGPRVGSVYGVLDDQGWIGLVEVTAEHGPDNDDGPQVHRIARYTTTTVRSARQIAYAFGPIDAPFPNARVIIPSHIPRDHATESAQVDLAIDLDGDGKQDLEQRLRCQKLDADKICLTSCTGVFVRGGESWRLAEEHCGSALAGG